MRYFILVIDGNNKQNGLYFVSSLLIGQFVGGTKSWLSAAGLHALIVIAQHGDNAEPLLYAAGAVIVVWILVDKFWKTENVE